MLGRIKAILESRQFELVITVLIIVNAVTLGLETSPAIMGQWGGVLHLLDAALLTIFVAELVGKIVVYRLDFFRSGWNLFDFVIIAIALVPAAGAFSVLRALRVLRVLRLITVIPSLKRVVGAMIAALPGMGSIIVLLLLVFYVSAVMATKLFQGTEPEAFGDIGRSFYTLFQLMTLDGWSGEIVKPVLENHPYAMLFFMPFILFSAFVVLNLFIGVVVGAMQDEANDSPEETDKAILSTDQEMLQEIRALRHDVEALRAQLERG
jgi:voltage-gated sodium channel